MNRRQAKKELAKAVANFNKVKDKLEKEEKNVILPESINFQDLNKRIITRQNLNEIVRDLRKFGKGDSLEIYETPSGERITGWEHQKLEKEKSRIIKRLNNKKGIYEVPNEQGFTRVQMGSMRYQKLLNDIRKFENYQSNVGYDFKEMRNILHAIGDIDYDVRKATTYRENYIEVMEKYKDFDNYELLEKKMNSLKNPNDFFEFFGKDDTSSDFDLTYQSEQFYAQQEFNLWLERLGIDINEDSIFSEERINNV